MTLFNSGRFTLHSGAGTDWLIDCDALTDDDLAALAVVGARLVAPYGAVDGVAYGGLRFARMLRLYATEGPLLIADDVLTTGASMERQRSGREAKGVAIFARGTPPPWVKAIFSVHPGIIT